MGNIENIALNIQEIPEVPAKYIEYTQAPNLKDYSRIKAPLNL